MSVDNFMLDEAFSNGYKAGFNTAKRKPNLRTRLIDKYYQTKLYQSRCKHIGKEYLKPYPTAKQLESGQPFPARCCRCTKIVV